MLLTLDVLWAVSFPTAMSVQQSAGKRLLKEVCMPTMTTNKSRYILQKLNGSAADAAVATVFCEGIAVSQSCGLGGGLFLTIYTKSTGKVETLNAREVAPKAASADMFVGETTVTGIR